MTISEAHPTAAERTNTAGGQEDVASGLRGRWYATPVRWQILITISLLTFLMGLVGIVLAVLDSRNRAAIETEANIELWRQHINPRAKSLASAEELPVFASRLAAEMANVRHVTIHVLAASGRPVEVIAPHVHPLESGVRESAPQWFVHLVQPEREARSIDILAQGANVGRVVIAGLPDDEIAEAWELLVKMAMLWLAAMLVFTVGLYFILGHILDPLLALAGGMRKLEDGQYAVRMRRPRVKEIAVIADNFNALAARLDVADAENQKLYRQLISVQEDERRQIARELHDEFGPCLFGIISGVGSIERQAQDIAAPQGATIEARIKEIRTITERLKSLNRGLLSRLRPVALGRIKLGELLSELVHGFEQRHPDVLIQANFASLPKGFGDAIDLTLYRCIQEGLTNALRHGEPSEVKVEVTCERGKKRQRPVAVRLTIADDGTGIGDATAPGFGISGMRERVKVLSGTLAIERVEPRGTVVSIEIPCTATTDE